MRHERTLYKVCVTAQKMILPGAGLGAGYKPPKAALVKSQGSERLGKVTAKDRGRCDLERRAQAMVNPAKAGEEPGSFCVGLRS